MGIPMKEVITSEVVMAVEGRVLNSAGNAVIFDLKPALCVHIGSHEECQSCGEWWW